MNKRRTTQTPAAIQPSQLQLLAVPEVAKLLSVGRTTVYALIKTGEISTVLIGSSRRVSVVSVHQYIEKNRQAS